MPEYRQNNPSRPMEILIEDGLAASFCFALPGGL